LKYARINFKKNEKIYDSTNSEVLKMLQEMDKEPQDEPDEDPAEVNHRAVAVNPPIKSQAPQQQPFVVHHPVVQQQQQQPKQQPVVIHHPIHQQQPQQQQQYGTLNSSPINKNDLIIFLFC
jgi:hypothetical protein